MAQVVELPLCPVRHVVVYADRAEVTREISLKDVEAGENEVTLNNISKVIDKDSVRIDGTGAASIMEVSFQDIPVTEEQDNQSELKEEVHQLEEELTELDKKFNISTKRKDRLEEQTDLLDKYTNTLVSSGKGAGPVELVSRDTIDNVFSFMDTFENESMELMTKKTDNEEERKKLSKRREEVKNRLSNLKPKIRTDENAVIKQTVIGIMLAVKERGDIKLL
ncbi:PREDICTED: uncharacterized protein LOC105316022, partial [Amphimedon queenslandica]|uniref:DUF4140 domain-containing protein n=1 Tax=Amphimedon queenslandica TaxID=400682 RepID=A0A1X7SNW1_AMPQE